MKIRLWLALACVLVPASTSAQVIDPCVQGNGAYVVTSGAPPLVTWVIASPMRINGWKLKLDNGPELAITPSPFGTGDPCPAGTPWAGAVPYIYRLPAGVSKGDHSLTLTVWRWKLDAFGNNTTEIEEAAVSIPFVAVDLIVEGPLLPPRNLTIRK